MNGLNWINQLEFNPSAFLQNFLPLNPFKRRGSTMSLKSNNSFESGAADLGSLTYNQIKFAQLLGGSGKLKKYDGSELIELSSFGLVELDQVGSGIGHEFQVSLLPFNSNLNSFFALASVTRTTSQLGVIAVESSCLRQ